MVFDFYFDGVTVKTGNTLRSTGISYTRAREVVLDAFCQLGYPAKLFGLHSLRSGGATAAANAGVTDRLFKRHGRWRSDKAKDGYVKDNLDALLSVSKKLESFEVLFHFDLSYVCCYCQEVLIAITFIILIFLFLYFNKWGDSCQTRCLVLILVCV